jgi:hypothetical protein
MNKLARNDKERQQIKKERNAAKQMEPQYWLEIVDHEVSTASLEYVAHPSADRVRLSPQHRYGSNLKYYHQKWNETDTSENFFYVSSDFLLWFF